MLRLLMFLVMNNGLFQLYLEITGEEPNVQLLHECYPPSAAAIYRSTG